MTLRVDRIGRVMVRAPRFVSKKVIERFVQRRVQWIIKRQQEVKSLAQRFPIREFIPGESFPLLGRHYRLSIQKVVNLNTAHCVVNGKRLTVMVTAHLPSTQQELVKGAIQQWYCQSTEKKAATLMSRHAANLGVSPRKMRVVDQRTRWASCSMKGDLRFNWRLSMMPVSVLEYVVVHELCHLNAMNHSDGFWNAVKSILPDYEKSRGWLRSNGSGLLRAFPS